MARRLAGARDDLATAPGIEVAGADGDAVSDGGGEGLPREGSQGVHLSASGPSVQGQYQLSSGISRVQGQSKP